MRFTYTDGGNSDFIELCHSLDNFLNELVGGEENREEYIPYNQLDDIYDVIIEYDDDIPVGSAGFKKYDNISNKLMELLEKVAKGHGYHYLILES